MNNLLLKKIQEEGINAVAFSRYRRDKDYHKKGELKEVYICSITGGEINLDTQFLDEYDITEEWMNPIQYTSTGYVQKSTIYRVIEKAANKVVYEK